MARRKTWKDLVREKQADLFNQEETEKPKEGGKPGRCQCGSGGPFTLRYHDRDLLRKCQQCGTEVTV